MDAAPHRQARRCGLLSAEQVDGGRQGPEEGLGAAIAGALPCAPCGCNGADPDDRATGFCVSTFAVKQEQQWFWWLIGIDQALHHLTGFGLSIFMAAN